MSNSIPDSLYRDLFRCSEMPMLIIDAGYRIINANEAYTGPDPTGLPVAELLVDCIPLLNKAREQKAVQTNEQYRVIPAADKDMVSYFIISIAAGSRDQKRAKEEQRKLISLVENSVDLMSILNMEGFNSYINEAGKKMLGFTSDEQVFVTPVSDLHRPEDLVLVQQEVIPSVMTKGRWSGMMLVKHLQTDEVFSVFNNCFRIDDPVSGEPLAIGAVMRDMRPEVAAKKALADSEALLRNITTAAPTALWMCDTSGAITYVNETWLRWTVTSLDSNLGYNWLNIIDAEDREKVAELFTTAISQRKLYEAEFRIKKNDGGTRWCIANGQPQYDEAGEFTGYIGACIDISEQKQLQQQKDDFIAIASHELKTPVTSIKGFAQVLQKIAEKQGDGMTADMMARLNKQVNRLTYLIGDLLDVTKINAGQLQFNDDDFDLNQLATELTEDLQSTTETHKLKMHFDQMASVNGDKERIGQVITNLISNAIKYSPEADSVDVYLSVKENEILFSVQDHGIGIPADKLKKVFKQFYRVSQDAKNSFPGLGLGLFISAEIIRRQGGKIWAESEGKGSTFSFTLPRKR